MKSYKPTYKLRFFSYYHFDNAEFFLQANKPYLYPVV